MQNKINKKIPISSIILPFLYGFSGIVCLLYSSEIYTTTFQVISVFNPEFNIVKIGSFHIIYAFIIRIVYTKSLTTYFSIIPFLALYEFVTFGLDIYLFTFNQVAHILYTAVFHFGLFVLLIYERRIFK
tara:strand:+ start:55 stop:441 length:387 start_codon:yes stop_codon:yes gene_type:complete